MTGSAQDGFVSERDGDVLTITLARPERLNAVTDVLLDRLADHVLEHGHVVRAIVLTGQGRAFCAGADLTIEATPPPDGARPAGISTVLAANRLVLALRDCPAPIVAAVNGPAVGVGASLVLVSDVVLAARSAYILLPFTGIALLPDGGATALLAASVGRNRAMALSLCPERTTAEDAMRMGIVHRVVDDDALAGEAQTLAMRLATGARHALAATKAAVNAATLGHLEAALERELDSQSELVQAPDFSEAVTAFADRRPPEFGA
jgi:enoyl-CoA hydratase